MAYGGCVCTTARADVALEDGTVHADLGGGEHHVGVVLLEACVDDVALLELRQHRPTPRDQDAISHADAHVSAVRADDAGQKEIAADALELLEDGGTHGRPSGAPLTPPGRSAA